MLPRQPLPDLNASLNRYLNSLRPILMSGDEKEREQMRRTEACVRRFLDPTISDSNGLVLQDILYRRAVSRENWALEKNLDQYLTDTKNCLPIHASPAKVMKRQRFDSESDYLTYVTLLMKAIHQFKAKIDTYVLFCLSFSSISSSPFFIIYSLFIILSYSSIFSIQLISFIQRYIFYSLISFSCKDLLVREIEGIN